MPSPHPLGSPFIELSSVESTNNYAIRLAREGMALHGTAVFAHSQFKGKGQRSKQWISEPGKNIALSLVLQPSLLNNPLPFHLSMAIALGTYDLLVSQYSSGFSIKWPNDIYWNDRKAGGILLENSWTGKEWKFTVAGIGVNINQTDFGELAPRPVSLLEITGKEEQPLAMAKKLCVHIESRLELLKQDPNTLTGDYHLHLYRKGLSAKFKAGTRVFEAVVERVNDDGKLQLRHALTEEFAVGEVQWL